VGTARSVRRGGAAGDGEGTIRGATVTNRRRAGTAFARRPP